MSYIYNHSDHDYDYGYDNDYEYHGNDGIDDDRTDCDDGYDD